MQITHKLHTEGSIDTIKLKFELGEQITSTKEFTELSKAIINLIKKQVELAKKEEL